MDRSHLLARCGQLRALSYCLLKRAVITLQTLEILKCMMRMPGMERVQYSLILKAYYLLCLIGGHSPVFPAGSGTHSLWQNALPVVEWLHHRRRWHYEKLQRDLEVNQPKGLHINSSN